MRRIIYHADDFGANEEVSEHILDCYREGALNSLSVLPNSPCLARCMEMLRPYQEKVAVSIHFNLAEGHCLADPGEVPWLVDERGMFDISFFKVLLLSFTGKRRELKRQIRTEMQAQLERMLPYVSALRIDSHQHYHMIPVVLKSILEAAGEHKIAFIRIPAEPITPFLRHPKLYHTYRPINLVKNLVLNVLRLLDEPLLRPYRKKSAVFFGIVLSCEMDLRRVRILMGDFRRIADKRGLPLEVLCHPGRGRDAGRLMDPQNTLCREFYASENRSMEKETLMKIAQPQR